MVWFVITRNTVKYSLSFAGLLKLLSNIEEDAACEASLWEV